jgi:hypothetical protein
LKAANVLRLEAERKITEFISGEANMNAYYGVAVRDTASLKPSSGLGGLSKEKVKLVGYVAVFLLLFEALIFLIYLGLTAL